MKTLVTYASHYGSSKQYAAWIAEELHGELRDSKTVKPDALAGYDTIIHVGWLCAGSTNGAKLLSDNASLLTGKRVAMVSVGFADPADPENAKAVRENATKQLAGQQAELFLLRGDMLPSKMSTLHKLMMSMMRSMLRKKPKSERTEADTAIIEKREMRFVDRATIAPIVSWAKQ